MKKLNVLAGIGCAALMSYGVAVYAGPTVTQATNTSSATTDVSSTTVSWNDKGNNAYGISVSQSGNVWTYTVSEVAGKSLSHWLVGITSCAGHITSVSGPSSTQSSGSVGVDGSTGVNGLKWDTNDGFTSGSFVITLDKEYAVGTTTVLAKAGTIYATNGIQGPDCTKEVTPPPVLDCTDAGYAAANPEECTVTPPPVLDCTDEGYAAANPEECTVTPPPVLDCTDEGYAAANPEACEVTYGDSNASVVGIWKYVGSMSVQDFDATYKEGTDYVFTGDDSGEYLLQGIDDKGNTTSMSGAKMK